MNTSVRGFSIAHQKVSVDVEVQRKSLRGWTELTIVPTTLELKEIILDARRLEIEKCYVNGIKTNFEHFDLLSHPPKALYGWGVHQHSLYGEKLRPLLSKDGQGPGELSIAIPDSVKIREPNEATFIASHSTKEKTYEPLTLRVFYHINEDGPNEGLQFVGMEGKEPHVYTTHTPLGQATSCWLPCVDGLWSLSTWELEFSIPQLLDKNEAEAELFVACNNASPNEEPDPFDSTRKIVKFGLFSPVSSQHVGFAIGPFVQTQLGFVEEKQARRDLDPSLVNQNASAATATSYGSSMEPAGNGDSDNIQGNGEQAAAETAISSHMSTAAAAIASAGDGGDKTSQTQQQNLSSAQRPANKGRLNDSQSLPITVYVLPSKAPLVSHSCSTLPRAMEYFTRDFGSFPYDSYSVVFVSDFPILANTTLDACALTLCSENLLFTADMIEPRFTECEILFKGIAAQWCGVNIVPSSWQDIWVTEGIALYMSSLFIRKLMGNNEYRFRIRKGNEELCKEDIDRPPIGNPHFRFPLYPDDLKFIRLKAPLVLFILDRRMTKTDRSLGVSRVLTKLFLQSMSGDLRSQLSTSHFVRQCEKVAHHRLTKFFEEWVYGSGYPIFRITQRFNKKRLCIEMGIGQVHSLELPTETLKDVTFLERAVTHLDLSEQDTGLTAEESEQLRLLKDMTSTGNSSGSTSKERDFLPMTSFTGPMTIRIHEANGTPYEHVVELRDQLTKIDIPYNTKYKRLRRAQKFKKATAAGKEINGTETGDGLINCLGDVLMSDKEIQDWLFVDWGDGGEEEEGMFNEAFEWLRADADFEWLGQFFVSQPDYMYASQLQQDRDIVAQYDAVTFYGRQQPNPIYCTVLTRTLVDQRYYYGIRIEAAYQLAKLAVPQLQYAGMHLLLRVFRELFCVPRSRLPRANDFHDFPSYFVQKAIPQALSRVRDHTTGHCPPEICSFILDLIRYNENSENRYSDSFYVANLLECATNTLRQIDLETGEFTVRGNLNMYEDEQVHQYVVDVVNEIDKCQRLDRWVPSHLRIITQTAIKMEELLILAGFGEPRMDKLLYASQDVETTEARLAAISSILHLGGYRNPLVIQYLFRTMIEGPSARLHHGFIQAFERLVGHIAIHGEYQQNLDPRRLRQLALARKSVQTAIPLLRETLGQIEPVRKVLWESLLSPQTGCLDRRLLLEICHVLYKPEPKLLVRMKAPKLFELSLKRSRSTSWIMVAKYRNITKKRKGTENQEPQPSTQNQSDTSPIETPKLKLRLR